MPNYDEMVATTLRLRRPNLSDAITNNNAFMYLLRKNKRIELADGGRSITETLIYGENANHIWYTAREAIPTAGQEAATFAEFFWKWSAVAINIANTELLMNDGKSAIIKLMKGRMIQAEATIANQANEASIGDGTAHSGKVWGGLDLIVPSATGATVGGIDSSVDTWWDSIVSAQALADLTPANIQSHMLSVWLKLERTNKAPTLILAGTNCYEAFETSMVSQKRYAGSDASLGKAGFTNVMYKTAPVAHEPGMDPNEMKFLNLNTMGLTMHSKRNNAVINSISGPNNEDSVTKVIASMGNLTCNSRRDNGSLAYA